MHTASGVLSSPPSKGLRGGSQPGAGRGGPTAVPSSSSSSLRGAGERPAAAEHSGSRGAELLPDPFLLLLLSSSSSSSPGRGAWPSPGSACCSCS